MLAPKRSKLIEIYNVVKRYIYDHYYLFCSLFMALGVVALYSFWWLSLLSICFFTWNLLNEKQYLTSRSTLLLVSLILTFIDFAIFIPTQKWGEEVQRKWDKNGYDSTWVPGAQESINVIARSIENYRLMHGCYPNRLRDIHEMEIIDLDLSYRIKGVDGQTIPRPFYYEKIDSDQIYLAGVGKDGIIKTKDDLVPQISNENEKSTGLVKYVVKSFSYEEKERERKLATMLKKAKKIHDIYTEKQQ